MDQLRDRLASKKIYPAPTESVLYRYTYEDILIDFIPFEETPLGPTNRWLKPGFQRAYPVTIGKTKIKILPVSMYLATKWEAFKNRGGDLRLSHDFEDIIYVIDNNSALIEDVSNGDKDVRDFLKDMSMEILSNSSRDEIIECHLNQSNTEERRELVVEKLRQINNLI